MQVHLNLPLDPGTAPRHAAAIVATAADISGAQLDYSPESIDLVEDIVDGFRAEGATDEDMADSLVAFGCYVGEVPARHTGGSWRRAPASRAESSLILVELPDTRECHPIDWVFQRLQFGSDINIRELCTAGTAPGPTDERTRG